MNRKPLLDVFRLLLALEVVREHYSSEYVNHRYFYEPAIVPAVALFLGISGFVIPGSWLASRNWGHFLWKRLLRLAPAFGVSLGLVALAGGSAGVLGMLGAYLTLGLHTGMNGVVWSLGWEEIFYASLGLLFVCGEFKKPAIAVLVVVGIVAPFAIPTQVPILLAARPLMAAFFTGNLCYLFRERLAGLRWLGLAGLVLLIAEYRLGAGGDMPPALVPGLNIALMVACLLAVGTGFSPRLPKFPDLSYGVYLYHLPLAWLLGRSWQGLAVVLGFALLSAILVEQPFLKLKDLTVQKGATATPLINVPSSLQIR